MADTRQQEIAEIQSEINQIKSTLAAIEKAKKGPGMLEEGGFVDRNLLRGQLPTYAGFAGGLAGGALGAGAGGVGAPIGGLAGAGLGGAAGQNLQDILRSSLGMQPMVSMSDAFKRAGMAGAQTAAMEAGGQAIGPALKMAGSGISNIASKVPGLREAGPFLRRQAGNISQSLGTSSIPQPTREIAEAVASGKPSLGSEVAQRGIYGFKRDVLEFAKQRKENFGRYLGDALNSFSKTGIDPNDVVKATEDIERRFIATGRTDAAKIIEQRRADWLNTIIKNKSKVFATPDTAVGEGLLTPAEANILKRQFAAEAKSVFGKDNFDAVSSVNAEFAQSVSKGLRQEIEKIVPSARHLNKEYRFYDNLVEALSLGLAQDLKRGGLTIAQPFTTAGASAAGGALGGGVGALAAGAGVQVGRLFPVKTYLAAQLAKVSGQEITPELATEVSSQMLAHPTFKQAIFKVLSTLGTAKAIDKTGKSTNEVVYNARGKL